MLFGVGVYKTGRRESVSLKVVKGCPASLGCPPNPQDNGTGTGEDP